MPESENPFTCPACGTSYSSWPGKHICPDGRTHADRIRQPYSSKQIKLYDKYDLLELTEDDKKLLKGMKVVP